MNPSEMAKRLGRRGGRARDKSLPAHEKKQIAAMGARARLESLQAARRIIDNLRYAEAVDALRGQDPVKRVAACAGPLPGTRRAV